jgi:hypothetical protein
LKEKSSVTKPALPQPQKSPYLLRPKKEKAEEEEKRVTRQKKASSTHTADSGVSNTSPVRSEDMYEDTDYSYDSSDSSDSSGSSGSSDSDDSSTAKQYVSDGSSGHSEPRTPEWEDESEATADSAVSDVSSRPPSRIEQRQVQRFVSFMAFAIYDL